MDLLLGTILGAGLVGGAVWARTRLFGFAGQKPTDYAGEERAFDIREQLNGPIDCEGVIFGPTGRVSSRFVAEFDAKWDGDKGVMAEHFSYDSGVKQDREWRLTLLDGGRIQAEADDLVGKIVGKGTGQQTGSGVVLRYSIRLSESAGGHMLDVVDWMYLMENGTIMNRSQFRKYGIKVAELVATMRPREAAQAKAEEQDAA